MTEWQADDSFLDFLVRKMESEGLDQFQPLMGSSQRTYTSQDLVEEMNEGTRLGKKLYGALYSLYSEEFNRSKK